MGGGGGSGGFGDVKQETQVSLIWWFLLIKCISDLRLLSGGDGMVREMFAMVVKKYVI